MGNEEKGTSNGGLLILKELSFDKSQDEGRLSCGERGDHARDRYTSAAWATGGI